MSEKTLSQKLLEVAQSIDYFEKRGYNPHHKYNYVAAVDVVAEIRTKLFERGIIVIPGCHDVQQLPFGEPSKGKILTTAHLTYEFIDVESDERIVLGWAGSGADTGGDKGLYKAYTGGLKYALQALTLAPMTDDPERDNLTEVSEDPGKAHKDDARPAAPLIPADRATDIFRRAKDLGYVQYDMEAEPGTPPKFHLALQAALGLRNVTRIGELNVDQAEGFEKWLAEEEVKQIEEDAA